MLTTVADPYRVIIAGSRNLRFPGAVYVILNEILAKHPNLTVVHGGRPTGADRFAADWCDKARDQGRHVIEECHPADWYKYGVKGPQNARAVCNREMAQLGADEAHFFFESGWTNDGTTDCYNECNKADGVKRLFRWAAGWTDGEEWPNGW